jgi:hypothetical protein
MVYHVNDDDAPIFTWGKLGQTVVGLWLMERALSFSSLALEMAVTSCAMSMSPSPMRHLHRQNR